MATTKLYNKGKRTIYGLHLKDLDEKGNPKPYTFKPESAAEFDKEEADKLRDLYPQEVLSMEDVRKDFSDKTDMPPGAPTMVPLSDVQKYVQDAVDKALAAEREKNLADEGVKEIDESNLTDEQKADMHAQEQQQKADDIAAKAAKAAEATKAAEAAKAAKAAAKQSKAS